MTNAYVKEVFESIQGEALYIGQKQIFIRFCGCNLHCNYCDTDFKKSDSITVDGINKTFLNPVTPSSLNNIIQNFNAGVISLTGGEPLLYTDFLLEFLPMISNKKIHLETNGTMYKELEQVIKRIDVVSMDIKLPCSTKEEACFFNNEEFIKIAIQADKEIFAKIILNKNYSKTEILNAIKILKPYNIPLIIQPMDCKDKSSELDKNSIKALFDFVTEDYANIRLIPQVHKFLGLL